MIAPPIPATSEAIARAARYIRQGGLVAFPTETVYGLGADATSGLAVAAIFSAKGRPTFNPLIVHVASLDAAERIGVFGAASRDVARLFWPGPLTLVVPRVAGSPVSDLATAGLDTIAIRIPDHPVALALMREADCPIAAPSANRSGRVSPTTAEHVAADLGDAVGMILDGGAAKIGIESTVLDMTGPRPRLLRPGGATREALEALLGRIETGASADPARPASPGQLASHYAPSARLRLDCRTAAPGEALLAFGPNVPPHIGPSLNLSTTGDLSEAAANLFAHLRALDATGVATIAVMAIPHSGLGLAIDDRLRRAAAPRAP